MTTQKLESIIQMLSEALEDVSKSESGNASAGRRARKVCMEASKELKDLRAKILEEIKK